MKKRLLSLSTTHIILLSFLAAILTGAILLSLPISSADGKATPFLDALFTATTSTCVTGLVVTPTVTSWSVFGQIVILLLIQIGGLGVITIMSGLMILLHRKMPVTVSLLEQEQTELVLALQQRFERHYDLPYTLQELAKEYNVSPSSLSHRFKEVTGVPVMEYLLSCRLAAAKNHLIDTDLSVGQIVERCGFSDNSNFSRTFRQNVGLSPSAFRALYK